ncbi:MAG: AAA family ATPase [Chloroflexota bacterium]
MIKLPYGRRNFVELISENYLYLDRTHYISKMEDWGKELILMRPRRFGKSLWLSTLMNYYDVAKADQFGQLFGKLYAGQNPTSLQNSYMVMRWDFSRVASHGSIDEIESSLNTHIISRCRIFAQEYKAFFSSPIEVHSEDALITFDLLVNAVRHAGYKLYLFIDEYDNFANEVMMASRAKMERGRPFGTWPLSESQERYEARYETLVKGEGLFKTFFKNLKSAGSGDGLDRIFMTGVSPIVLNDVTSGANVFEDLTWQREFNELCGFTQDEVSALVEQVVVACQLPKHHIGQIVDLLENYYDGFRFVDRFRHSIHGTPVETPRVYNPTLTFHFLKHFQNECDYPIAMIDQNLVPDDSKLAYIGAFPEGKSLLEKALSGEKPIAVPTVRRKFGSKDLFNSNLQHSSLAVLLCYLGGLTSVGEESSGQTVLAIPNLVMRTLYAERILSQLTDENAALIDAGNESTRLLFVEGNIEPLCGFVEEHLLPVYDNRDARYFNELTVKTLFMALLYNNQIYLMESEPELAQRYGDLLMLVRPGMTGRGLFDILIEFKYVPLSKAAQGQDGKVRKIDGQAAKDASLIELMKLKEVQSGFADAKEQLQIYRQTLLKKHDGLNLRTVAVVSIGMKRVLWEVI